MTIARYHKIHQGSTVQCVLCPHQCVIADGERGRCRVRLNSGGTLYAEMYGAVSSLALDPIEKKPFAHFYPLSHILSVGGYGCNLSCSFCQNHEISQTQNHSFIAERPASRIFTGEMLVLKALEEKKNGNIGIAFTYNEPLIGYEFVLDTLILSRKAKLVNVLVTNGYINKEPLDELLPYIDGMNIDLKGYTDKFYRRICGGRIDPVLETIKRSAPACHVEVTTLIIPGLNSSPGEIASLAEWLSSVSPDIPLHLNRHRGAHRMLEPSPIKKDELFALADIARKYLHHVQCGNI